MGIQLVSRRVMGWDHSLSHRVEPGSSNHVISGYLGAWLLFCAGSVLFNRLIKQIPTSYYCASCPCNTLSRTI